MNWSIVIFCYNEGGNLAATAANCLRFLQQHAQHYEIIVVNDGSTDNTGTVCSQLQNTTANLRVVTHPENKGIGAALKTGYQQCRYEYVCAVPGDGQFNTAELQAVKPFAMDSFYSFYRRDNHYNFYRQTLTFLNKLFNSFFLGISLSDVNWIKVYRREQLQFARIQLNSSIIESEICGKLIKAGCRPVELPSVYNPRATGEPKGGSWKTLKKAMAEAWTLYRTVRSFKQQLEKPQATTFNAGPKEVLAGTTDREI